MTSLKGGNCSSILSNTIIGINVGWDCTLLCKLTMCSSLMTVYLWKWLTRIVVIQIQNLWQNVLNMEYFTLSKDSLKKKIHTFIQENHITCLNRGLTDLYQKQIQRAIQKCSTVIEKCEHKYLMNIKPMAPNISAHIKTHKINEPIRPVINNIHAPSYKVAK